MSRHDEHILVACHAWYGDTIGGSFRLASEFAEYLAQQGHKVTYVCCDATKGSSLPVEEVINGVCIHRYPMFSNRKTGLGRLIYHVSQTRKLVSQLNAKTPVTHLSSHSPLQGLGATYALTDPKVFKNYTVHSPFDDELLSNIHGNGPGLMTRIAGRLAHWVDRQNIKLADRVQTDSRYTLENLTGKHSHAIGKKGIVSPGWVDAQAFATTSTRHELRQKLSEHWQTALPIFFTLRRLEARMGLDTLITAAQIVKQEGRDFRVLIGGGGSLKNELQRQIDNANLPESVILLGRLSEADLPVCYAAADCFVLPTRALECFGLIVLEALAAGTPVIASRAAAIPELAEQQGSEWMFSPGDADGLADRMSAFLKGELTPRIDFSEMVSRYDRPLILKEWTKLLLGNTSQ